MPVQPARRFPLEGLQTIREHDLWGLGAKVYGFQNQLMGLCNMAWDVVVFYARRAFWLLEVRIGPVWLGLELNDLFGSNGF